MSISQNHIGISITSSNIQLVELTYSDKNYVISNVDEEYLEEFLDFDFKETKFISIIQNAFDNFLIRNVIQSPFISFALPTSEFYFFEIPIDSALHKEDLEKHIRWEFSIVYPNLKYEDFVCRSFQPVNNPESKTIVVVCLKRKIINALNKFALRNKLQLKYIDSQHVASNIAISYGTQVADLNVFSISIEENNFSILFANEQNPIYFKKKSFWKFGEFNDLFDEEFKRFKDKVKSDNSIQKFYLFSSKNVSELKKILEEKVNCEISELNPFEFLLVDEKIKRRDQLKKNPNRFSAAAGMAYRLI